MKTLALALFLAVSPDAGFTRHHDAGVTDGGVRDGGTLDAGSAQALIDDLREDLRLKVLAGTSNLERIGGPTKITIYFSNHADERSDFATVFFENRKPGAVLFIRTDRL